MSDGVLAAVITAAAAVFGTLAFLVVELRKERRANSRREAEVDEAFSATAAAGVYPYTSAELRTTVAIVDANGAAVTEKRTVGVRAARGTVVQGFHADMDASGGLVEVPTLTYRSRPDIDLRGAFDGPTRYKYEIHFQSGLSADDPPCSFAIRWAAKQSLFVNAASIRAHYGGREFDFHSETVSTPLQRLEITIRWPKPGAYEAYPNVTFGDLDTVASAERRRIEHGFVSTPEEVTLTVDEPKVGLRYMIAWRGGA